MQKKRLQLQENKLECENDIKNETQEKQQQFDDKDKLDTGISFWSKKKLEECKNE